MSYTPSIKSTGSATSGISRGMKAHVRKEAKLQCWLCKAEGHHVAHVIPRGDPGLLNQYIKNGLLNEIDINSKGNLIFLCSSCHTNFDWRIPAWVFLPFPLRPFLTAERAFQTARQKDPSATRVSPPEDVFFQPYLIRERFVGVDWSKLNGPLKWDGNPILAILRSYAIVAGLQRLPEAKGGVPQEVVEMYFELMSLYGTPAPVEEVVEEEIGMVEDTADLDTITVQQPDTIRVVPPSERTRVMAPPPRRGRGTRTHEAGDSVNLANAGQREQNSASNRQPLLNEDIRRKMKRPAETVSEFESDATSEQSGHSNDSQFTTPLPRTRAAKRTRTDASKPVGDISGWVGIVAGRKRNVGAE